MCTYGRGNINLKTLDIIDVLHFSVMEQYSNLLLCLCFNSCFNNYFVSLLSIRATFFI
jgi:hypothetical protein